jgi:hypothetical protein
MRVTPAFLFLGRELNHPLGLKWRLTDLDLQQSSTDTKVFWERALANLKKARDRVARRYNELRSEVGLRVGDLVCVKLHPQSSKILNRSAKIADKWSDPFTIAKFLTNVTVQMANPETGVIVRKAHVSQLKRSFMGD